MFWFLFFMAVIAAVYGIGMVVSVLGWLVAFLLAIPVMMIGLYVLMALLLQRR
jgi:hypothetical protein